MSQAIQVAVVVVAGVVFVVRLAIGLRQAHIRGRIAARYVGREQRR